MSFGWVVHLLVSHWQPIPALNIYALLAAGLYLAAVRRARGRWPAHRTAAFLAGIGVVLVALESGIGTYDDRLLSVHMVQHMLLLLAAPLLLLTGRPTTLALRALPGPGRRRLARAMARGARFTGPLACLAVFSAVLIATHLPGFYDATLGHAVVHDAEHLLYLLAGCLLWWPLLDADPVPAHRLTGLGRLLYTLAAMPAMALVGAYLNRVPHVVYAPYDSATRALGASPLVDQAEAGAIMWVAGGLIVTAVGLWVAMAAMVAEERRLAAREARGVL